MVFNAYLYGMKTNFNSHLNHNPDCDIVEGRLNIDTFITFGIYVNDTKSNKKGDKFMELYTGENYNVHSKKRSHSRHYTVDKIPAKYKGTWELLQEIYLSKYLEVSK